MLVHKDPHRTDNENIYNVVKCRLQVCAGCMNALCVSKCLDCRQPDTDGEEYMNATQIIENYENTFKVSITSDLTLKPKTSFIILALKHHDEVDKFTAVT